MDTMKIADEFGEKIGGSKRDLWRIRGLCVSDLLEMNDAEIKKYVKKDSVWPKPNYQAMKDAGKDIRVVWFVKTVKDAVATKPQNGDNESYVEEVGKLRDAVMQLDTIEKCLSFSEDYFLKNGMYERKGYSISLSPAFRNIGGAALINVTLNVRESTLEREIKKKQFLYTEFEKFCSNLKVERKGLQTLVSEEGQIRLKGSWGWHMIANGKDMDISDFNSKPGNSYYILNGYKLIAYGIEEGKTEETLKKLFEKQQRDISETSETKEVSRKKRFVPQRLENCRRIIHGENRMIFMNVAPESLLDTFKFRGGECGNWLNNETRQESINRAYEAFEDLAAALNIPYEQVALNGRLAIAFGARGNGNAAAHYEPMREVINLTKFSGAGSLAHEYGHAIDDILSKEMGNKVMFTETYHNNLPSMVKLLEIMRYRKVKKVVKASDQEANISRNKKDLVYMIQVEFKAALRERKEQVEELGNTILDMLTIENGNDEDVLKAVTNRALETVRNAKKEMIPRSRGLTKEFEWRFPMYFQGVIAMLNMPEEQEVEVREQTDYYKNSLEFDKMYSRDEKGYWASGVEMFARAFSCYITDKLNELGIVNDYLSGSSEVYVARKENGEIIRAVPEGAERKAINAAIDAFIAELKEKKLLSDVKIAVDQIDPRITA